MQRVLRLVVAFAVSATVAWFGFRHLASVPGGKAQRQVENAVVAAARDILATYVAPTGELEIVDPLHKNRVAGKVFIYPLDDGWQVSGHYRRKGEVFFHPWLMTLDNNRQLRALDVSDNTADVVSRAAADPRFTTARSDQ